MLVLVKLDSWLSTDLNQMLLEGRGLKLNTAEDVREFVEQLMQQDVEEIRLSGNTIGVEAAEALAGALKHKKHIKIFYTGLNDLPNLANVNCFLVTQVVNLSDVFTGRLREEIPPALKAICDALVDKEHLVELNLSDNAFGPAGAEPLVDFLTNQRSLQTLRLNNNGLGVGGGTMIARALLAAAEKNASEGRRSSLRTIVCGRNRLENGSSQLLADAFAAHGTLVEVVMPQNGIRPEGISNLARGLAKCTELEVLDFQDNTCTEIGSQAIAEALPSWPRLRKLNLGDCLLSAPGGLAIAQALAKGRNAALAHMNLSYNEIKADAVAVIAEAIRLHLVELTSLELNGNCFEPEHKSILAVIEALEKHGHGDALDELDDMDIEEEEVCLLSDT
ncbi:uncharacterized protein VTP21DRAFT_440 [Calcarisporiella thermophila]|uniref:uncharacterized protein n=1 Tax=Calcarisporiella thermophila TaxID=911321 RepID=UPI0037444328